jgi:signal transduction histidine kinase
LPNKQSAIIERTKPFRLVKYFTFTSLVLVFLGTLMLSMFNTHWARALLRQKSEAYSQLLVENLNHQVFIQFILPVAVRYGQIELRREEQAERMDKVVRSTLHSFQVEMVNIYDRAGTIAYSFDAARVGVTDAGGRELAAALAGETTIRLVQQGNWLRIFLGIPEESRLVTFAPLRAERPLSTLSGPVLGAVEITQDISDDYRAIFDFQVSVIYTSTGVMGLLLLILIFIVRRGEHLIEQRNQERLRLKEELSRAAHLASLGEMIAAVSHEIRNPLGIIRSSAELLKKKLAGTPRDTAIADIIVEEATRLNGIITDFLNYARPAAPHLTPCRVETVIEKAIVNLSPEFESRDSVIERRFDPSLPTLQADADMLYQAFLNLLINALQAMPSGGKVEVDVRLENAAVQISIQDQGEGFSEEVMAKIWDPFFTTKERGTGLGLGIVRKVIEAHEGEIHIENSPAGGARALIRLPVKAPEINNPQSAS